MSESRSTGVWGEEGLTGTESSDMTIRKDRCNLTHQKSAKHHKGTLILLKQHPVSAVTKTRSGVQTNVLNPVCTGLLLLLSVTVFRQCWQGADEAAAPSENTAGSGPYTGDNFDCRACGKTHSTQACSSQIWPACRYR